MDPIKLARLLQPLMPERVDRWLRIRETADPELRALIDTQIALTARKRFGDVISKLLLSLPPEKRIRGPIDLGTVVYDKERWPAGLKTSELLQGITILGRSGSGKTNAAFHILLQLIDRKIPFLFFDWKRTGRHLLPLLSKPIPVFTPGRNLAPFPFNPFLPPPGLEPAVHANHLIDVLGDAYTLGDGAKSLLQRALDACYRDEKTDPTIDRVIAEVDSLPAKGREHGWKISALRALRSLESLGVGKPKTESQTTFNDSLLSQSTILELNGLPQSAKKFLIPLICLWIYHAKLASTSREKLTFVILFEEAHHVLYRGQRAKETLLESLIRQFRELGIAPIVVDQHAHLLSSAALGNSFATVLFNQKDPADVAKAASLAGLDEEDRQWLSKLGVGEAIVKLQDRWTRPFLVRFPHVRVEKGAVTDRRLLALSGGSLPGSAASRALAGDIGQVRGGRLWDDALNEDALCFLHDVKEHRWDGVKARYQRLRLSGDKGTRLQRWLTERGWLEAETVETGNTRIRLLRLTKAAREALGLANTKQPRESIAHEYWKHWYAERYRGLGYTVEIEAPRDGGRVDVLATKGEERVGIEIETGKSDVVENVRNCLRSGYTRVRVVATTASVAATVMSALREPGLVYSRRVSVDATNHDSHPPVERPAD